MYDTMNILGQMIQKLRFPGLSVALRLRANTKHSCAFLMAHINKVSTCTYIAIPAKLSINMGAFLHEIPKTTVQEKVCSYIQTPS